MATSAMLTIYNEENQSATSTFTMMVILMELEKKLSILLKKNKPYFCWEDKKMANFDTAFEKTMKHEGFYSFDKDDAGGETYRGISRRYYPEWKGWFIIDKQKPNINHKELEPLVKGFYRKQFWNPNLLDMFPQDVANEMFDTGINLGRRKVAKFLQQSLNYLNMNGELFPDLVEDGIIGPKTLKALQIVNSRKETQLLLKIMNVLQGCHYLSYMKKSPVQEKFVRGWFTRVDISKE